MSDKLTFTLHELVSEIDASADEVLRDRYGVTGPTFVFLATCADVEPTDITTLARCLGVTKAAVSKRVPALVAEGWITTAGDPAHGRRVMLSLTERARDLVDRAGRDLDQHFTAMLADPRAAAIDAAVLNAQLNTLVAILREKGGRA
ncbi:MarR family winged helix-turn-helix transcriptional regulator [Demequina sp. NBRC 110053]|uniref:MarR family winged helix-turn-helix transcriptional regulator n=1 Tax=Demequina sp. NBRC 110053 TaxID=1570342 RepID=UPI0009FB9787|nr:MarR family winged helix-turn-helix transcriptional regulator [Demequina sp. NBRC 110053]